MNTAASVSDALSKWGDPDVRRGRIRQSASASPSSSRTQKRSSGAASVADAIARCRVGRRVGPVGAGDDHSDATLDPCGAEGNTVVEVVDDEIGATKSTSDRRQEAA
jgi:hypothetical protein